MVFSDRSAAVGGARVVIVGDGGDSGDIRDNRAGCFWQLTARNGRILGRSSATFDDRSQARADLNHTLQYGDRLALVVRHARDRAGWIWHVDEGRGRTVMQSHRAYERYDSCRRSGRRVLDELISLAGCDGVPGGGR